MWRCSEGFVQGKFSAGLNCLGDFPMGEGNFPQKFSTEGMFQQDLKNDHKKMIKVSFSIESRLRRTFQAKLSTGEFLGEFSAMMKLSGGSFPWRNFLGGFSVEG